MKVIATCCLVLLSLLPVPAGAAVSPVHTLTAVHDTLQSSALSQVPGTAKAPLPRWFRKMIQRKPEVGNQREEGEVSKAKKVLSVIALASGALSLIVVFAAPGGAVFPLILASLVTGAIALKNNRSRTHRTMAIVGMVLGGASSLVVLAILVDLVRTMIG